MKWFDVWYGDLHYGIYNEYELEEYVWPYGTQFICISHLP